MTQPPLTVVLPVHNAMPYLDAALQSVLKQTFREMRIIAIDDGSSDGSGEYLDAVQDERLVVLHQSCHGLGSVLNRGIDLCDTTFLARMDADDISLPSRFQLQIDRLLQDSELIAIGSPLTFLVHDKVQRGLQYPSRHQDIVDDLLRGESSLSHPTLMMRTSAARATRYRIAGAGEDLDFCLRLAEHGKLTNLETPQYMYRLHETSLSMTKQGDLECGYAYARLTAMQRRSRHPEISLAQFRERWSKRSLISRFRTRLVSISLRRYRQARLAWAKGHTLQATLHLLVSFTYQPLRALRVMLRKGFSDRTFTP